MSAPEEIIAQYDMEYLPGEGVWFSPVWRNDYGNAIYCLITPEHFSALHLLKEDELWVHHDGDPVQLLLLFPDGRIERPEMGRVQGMPHHVLVPAGTWQGATSAGEWSLVVCSLAPAFTGFRLADSQDDFSAWNVSDPELRAFMR